MTLNKRQIFGKTAESIAEKHLRKRGYKILERNYRTDFGEVDIIARHRGVIVFVEVKARKNMRYGEAKFAVTPFKQRKISMVALSYLKCTGNVNTRARFDVVTIDGIKENQAVNVLENAFDLAYG